MKNNKKKSSTMKKLLPAFAMLTVSAVSLSSATFAWFSMNTQVTATGMNVKAKAEGGIVISNESKSQWNASATATHSSSVELIPTSSKNMSDWYHAKSDDANSAKANQPAGDYTNITSATSVSEGVGVWTKGTNDTSNVYLLNSFFIKSSAEAMPGSTLYVNDVTVSGSGSSDVLDKSLRVAIKYGDSVLIYAPLASADVSYTVAALSDGAVTAKKSGTKNQTLNTNVTIPAYTNNTPIEAKVYVYFEGEDENCKSANLTANLDTLQVTVQFGTTAIS